jgi:acyl-CoA reductase-like NAD-dependent aldehyde dehydrogenase
MSRNLATGDDLGASVLPMRRIWTALLLQHCLPKRNGQDYPLWRVRILWAAVARIREHKSELALLDALDSGIPVTGMEFDVELGGALLDFFAGLATEIKGETIPVGAGKLNYLQREPMGVLARIVPFNHPVMFILAKMSTPLIAGNTVILTRLSRRRCSRCEDCGRSVACRCL